MGRHWGHTGGAPSAVYDVTSSDWGWSLRAMGDEVMALRLGLNCTQPPATSDLVLLQDSLPLAVAACQ